MSLWEPRSARHARRAAAGRAAQERFPAMATELLTGCAARGARVVDPHRVEYLDCGGYGVPLLGHAHPAVVQAVVGQVRRPSLLDRLMLDLVTPNGLDHVHTFAS